MKQVLFFFSLTMTLKCFSQIKTLTVNKSAIPSSIQFAGQFKQAVRWTDVTGDNLVIVSETGPVQSKTIQEDDYRDAALYIYHYLVKDDSCKLTWRVSDFVKECPVDLFLYFVKGTFSVTDLNKDGKAEVWMMFKNSCQGDVSPVSMKIIMYEDGKKYAVRGATRVQVSEKEHMGGSYSFDDAFQKAPAVFRKYADNLWQQHKIETWENK